MKEAFPKLPADNAAEAKEASRHLFRDLLSGERQEPAFVSARSNRQREETSSRRSARSNLPMAPRAAALAISQRSVVDLVGERLKPKLRQWVDQNLAGVVEQIIREEIRRITHGR